MRLACLAAALLSCVPGPAVAIMPTRSADLRIVCLGTMGTAFRISEKTAVSVAHVTNSAICAIGNKLINAVSPKDQDFSLVTVEPGPFLQIDCGGFVKGRRYVSRGFARNAPEETEVEMYATGETLRGFYVLRGTFTMIPGMSGGPVLDPETGKAVGTNNVYNYQDGISGSIPLKDTSVCSKS